MLALALSTLAGTLQGPVLQVICGVLAVGCVIVLTVDLYKSRHRRKLAQEPAQAFALADDLARLHSQGASICDGLRPVIGTELLGHLTDRVRQWDGSVRDRLHGDAPRALLTFNAEPFPEPMLTQLLAQAGPAERKRLVEFMDRKLAVLAGIIKGFSSDAA